MRPDYFESTGLENINLTASEYSTTCLRLHVSDLWRKMILCKLTESTCHHVNKNQKLIPGTCNHFKGFKLNLF